MNSPEDISDAGYEQADDTNWEPYRCTECGEKTRASSLPSYCPVCDTWGSME